MPLHFPRVLGSSFRLLGLAVGIAWLIAYGSTGNTTPPEGSVDPLGQDTADLTIGDTSKNQALYDQSLVNGKVQAPPTLRSLDGITGPFGWNSSGIVSIFTTSTLPPRTTLGLSD